tara:strand:- start:90 stop:383 length:294 start_codon:yes stop_codon:yes gene_type:complete
MSNTMAELTKLERLKEKAADAANAALVAQDDALVKYAAALDAALIDEGVAAYKETRSELHMTPLINDTWQVEDDDMVWYQGSLEDCQAYLKEQQDNE